LRLPTVSRVTWRPSYRIVTQGAHLLYHWNGQRITHVVVANEVIEMGG
jgi:hypothetical protein